jgi:hypothetical protein
MTKTKYYDLQMDDPQDDYDVEVVNANLKKIDEQMKTRENATDALQEPEFTVAEKRENIASKEKMPKILGKIAKFFTDLKTVAFSGKYSDLDGKPAIVNNNTATEAGSALDARQANPTIEGTMANQISQLNSDLSDLTGSLTNDINALNPSAGIKLYTNFSIGKLGAGWYRLAEIIFLNETAAKGANSEFVEILINQIWNVQVGCFHKVKIVLVYADKAKISSLGIGTLNLTKVRVVRKSNILYFDVFSCGYDNGTNTLFNIPLPSYIASAKAYSDVKIVPETTDGEVIVCSVDLADNV